MTLHFMSSSIVFQSCQDYEKVCAMKFACRPLIRSQEGERCSHETLLSYADKLVCCEILPKIQNFVTVVYLKLRTEKNNYFSSCSKF